MDNDAKQEREGEAAAAIRAALYKACHDMPSYHVGIVEPHLAALCQPQTDALKIAREALERIEVATRNEVRAGDKGYVSRYGINGIALAALEQSK
jgi:hypothetical protein